MRVQNEKKGHFYFNLDFYCFLKLFSNYRWHSCCRWWKLHNTLNHRWNEIYMLLLIWYIWILFCLLTIYRVSGFCYDTIFYDFTYVSRWGCGNSYPVDLQPRLRLWGKLSSKVSSVFARASWRHAISAICNIFDFEENCLPKWVQSLKRKFFLKSEFGLCNERHRTTWCQTAQ